MIRLIAALTLVGSAHATPDTDPRGDASDTPPAHDFAAMGTAPLRMDLDVGAWIVRAKGTAQNGGAELQLGDDSDDALGLGDLRGLFRGALTLSRDSWAVRLIGTHGSWGGTATLTNPTTWGGVPLAAGVPLESSLDMSWFAIEGHWRAHPFIGDGRSDTPEPVELVIGPHLGAAWIDLDQSLAGIDTGSSWWTVYGGGELRLDVDLRPFTSLVHAMSVDIGGSIGGTAGDGGLFYKVGGGLTLHFTPNVGASIGYRLMEYRDLSDGDWSISPSFPGLFASVNVSF